jgi:hypothetical protein
MHFTLTTEIGQGGILGTERERRGNMLALSRLTTGIFASSKCFVTLCGDRGKE